MSKFKMRTTKPEAGNKYYITTDKGGYSVAVKGSPTDECNVLANCVGYAYGRFNEIGGYGYCKYLAPTNAELFMTYKGSCKSGMTPKVGAVMVWQKGATLNANDGAGHVCIVERVDSETQVFTSESGWGASVPFWTQTRKKGSDGRWGMGPEYKFLGFIYNPAIEDLEKTCSVKIKPETRDKSKNQIKVKVDNVAVKKEYSNKSTTVCMLEKGYYEYSKNTKNSEGSWYKIGTDKWVLNDEKVTIHKKEAADFLYSVKVTCGLLRIRSGPGTDTKQVGSITDMGTYMIVEEKKGPGSEKGWGKLYSGAGWISLDWVDKI